MGRCEYCKRSTKKTKDKISFHKFPVDPKLAATWAKNIGKSGWTPNKNSILCSEHFAPECIEHYFNTTRLKRNSMPKFLVEENASNQEVHKVCIARNVLSENNKQVISLSPNRLTTEEQPVHTADTECTKVQIPKLLKGQLISHSPQRLTIEEQPTHTADTERTEVQTPTLPKEKSISFSSKRVKIKVMPVRIEDIERRKVQTPDSSKEQSISLSSEGFKIKVLPACIVDTERSKAQTPNLFKGQLISLASKRLSINEQPVHTADKERTEAQTPKLFRGQLISLSSKRLRIEQQPVRTADAERTDAPASNLSQEQSISPSSERLNITEQPVRTAETECSKAQTSNLSKVPATSSQTDSHTTSSSLQYAVHNDLTYAQTPHTMHKKLVDLQEKYKSKIQANKVLRQKVKRMTTTMQSLKKTVRELKEKQFIGEKCLNGLNALESTPFQLFVRMTQEQHTKCLTRERYPSDLRFFAMHLQSISPLAYEYVRDTFQCALPHPVTLNKWSQNVDTEPASTDDPLADLEHEAEKLEASDEQLLPKD